MRVERRSPLGLLSSPGLLSSSSSPSSGPSWSESESVSRAWLFDGSSSPSLSVSSSMITMRCSMSCFRSPRVPPSQKNCSMFIAHLYLAKRSPALVPGFLLPAMRIVGFARMMPSSWERPSLRPLTAMWFDFALGLPFDGSFDLSCGTSPTEPRAATCASNAASISVVSVNARSNDSCPASRAKRQVLRSICLSTKRKSSSK